MVQVVSNHEIHDLKVSNPEISSDQVLTGADQVLRGPDQVVTKVLRTPYHGILHRVKQWVTVYNGFRHGDHHHQPY